MGTVLKMTKEYELDALRNIDQILDLSDLPGTRGYLDEEAKTTIRSVVADLSCEGIHFIDSGNYHYLSLFWLEKIQEDFSLILFDNHPDMLAPSFGDITSCGGWALEAMENLPHLKTVYMIGMEKGLVEEIRPLHEKARVVMIHEKGNSAWLENWNVIPNDLPIYISFDEDVMSKEVLQCQWSQGVLSFEESKELIQNLYGNHSVIGLDLCGEYAELLQQLIL